MEYVDFVEIILQMPHPELMNSAVDLYKELSLRGLIYKIFIFFNVISILTFRLILVTNKAVQFRFKYVLQQTTKDIFNSGYVTSTSTAENPINALMMHYC